MFYTPREKWRKIKWIPKEKGMDVEGIYIYIPDWNKGKGENGTEKRFGYYHIF